MRDNTSSRQCISLERSQFTLTPGRISILIVPFELNFIVCWKIITGHVDKLFKGIRRNASFFIESELMHFNAARALKIPNFDWKGYFAIEKEVGKVDLKPAPETANEITAESQARTMGINVAIAWRTMEREEKGLNNHSTLVRNDFAAADFARGGVVSRGASQTNVSVVPLKGDVETRRASAVSKNKWSQPSRALAAFSRILPNNTTTRNNVALAMQNSLSPLTPEQPAPFLCVPAKRPAFFSKRGRRA